jgi:NAD(P)-dependent dehydrogenase (short-subunit alcohol dehydrogenase family)
VNRSARPTFAESYGPWALVAGASEGVGPALAERGVDVVLLARRQAVLDDVAAGISSRTGVRTRTLAVDLTEPSAAGTIAASLADLEIGFLAYCAGADPVYQPFLAQPVEAEATTRRSPTSWSGTPRASTAGTGTCFAPASPLTALRTTGTSDSGTTFLGPLRVIPSAVASWLALRGSRAFSGS